MGGHCEPGLPGSQVPPGLEADRGLGCAIADLDGVREVILATRHNAPALSVVAELGVDVDRAILGGPPARFGEYEEQVRREYAVYPDDVHRQGRAASAKHFLGWPRGVFRSHPQKRLGLQEVCVQLHQWCANPVRARRSFVASRRPDVSRRRLRKRLSVRKR